MWGFFTKPGYRWWSIGVTLAIVAMTWADVQLVVKINEWFGGFYDTIQKALGQPGAVTSGEFYELTLGFAYIAGVLIALRVLNDFISKHWVFRWRQSVSEYYQSRWQHARHIEGASQRLQEDTLRFSRIVEKLGIGLLHAVLTLIAFLPILWELSKHFTEVPFFGHVDHSLVWLAVVSALGGTAVLAYVGKTLPGIEYEIQKEEAAYRKELVLGEDDVTHCCDNHVNTLFHNVRLVHFKSYIKYFYFDMAKWSYLQGMVIVPYIAMGPTIVAGAITLGVMNRALQAMREVSESLQFIIRSWHDIVEILSVHKRLKEFEANFKE